MPTTIDSLQIEIQSNSTSASAGIRDLAKSLGELKSSGTVTTAIKNLDKLSTSLRGFADASNATRSIGKLAGALGALKSAGSVTSIATGISKLGSALQTVGNVDVGAVGPKIGQIAAALKPLSEVKAGGINTMVNGLSKLGKVTESLDDATIDAFAEKIKKLNAVLGPLSEKMTTIQTGLRGINSKARSAGSAVREMGDDVNGASINLSSFMFAIETAIQWLQQAVEWFSRMIAEAIEWDGIAARFGRGFGSQAQETYDWIQRLNEEMGINTQVFMQYSSIYATMLTGFGVAIEDATKMALGYTELTYDIWAGYNDIYKNFEDAADAVKSAIAGEVEPIRRAGFTIVESQLEVTAANHGLKISLESATEAQKSYLRYLTLVDQAHSQSLVGTYAKELGTAEGLMRTFSQQLKSLTQAFGSLFLPVLVKVMPWFQAFVELLEEGVRWVGALFGVEIQDIGDTWTDYSSGIKGAAENTDGVTDSLKGATKAAKELKNATLGIDELNVISPPSASSSPGGAGSGSGAGFEGLDVNSLWDQSIFDSIQSDVDAVKEKLRGWMPVIATVAGALAGLRLIALINDIKKIGTLSGAVTAVVGAFKGIKEFFMAAKQMAPEVGWLAALFPKLSGWFASIGTAISGAASAVGTFLGGITAPVWATIAAVLVAIGSAAYFVYQNWDELGVAVKEFFKENISPKLAEIKSHFDKMAEALQPLLVALKPVFDWFKKIGQAIGDFFKNIDWSQVWGIFGKIIEFIGHNVFKAVSTPIVVAFNVIVGVVENVIQVFSGLVQTISGAVKFIVALFTGGDVKAAAKEMWAGVVDVFKGLWGLLTDPIKDVYNGVVSWFTKLWDVLVGHSIVPDMINDIVKWFKGLPGKVIDSITKFVTDIVNKFKGLWSKLTSWWNSKTPLKAYTPTIGDIKAKLSSAWSSAKSWWDSKKSALKTYTAPLGDIKSKLSSAWTTARTWWNSKKAALNSYTPSIGSIKDRLVSAWNTAKKWWNSNVRLSIPSLSFKVTYSNKGLNTVQKAVVKALGMSGWPKLSFAANGGIFDTGSLIWAGERGPEIMANAGGGRTGVMNVQQMSDAVYDGVYAAVVAAMKATAGGGDGSQSVNVYLDGRQITAAVEKRQRERGVSVMGSQVYSY